MSWQQVNAGAPVDGFIDYDTGELKFRLGDGTVIVFGVLPGDSLAANVFVALNEHVESTVQVHGFVDTAPIAALNDLPDLTLRFENGLV